MAGSDQRGADPLELLGRQLMGRYTIRDRIANGGMSVVYRGQDDRLQRPVCVKVFFGLDRSQSVYQTSYEHFVQEAFALSQLSHPNTIRIYDFGYLEEEPRSPFHVSELMDGGTLLGHVRRQGTLTTDEAIEILEPIVGALTEAHSRGIVHRDIKPTNILFGSAGPNRVVKLADFGIAKAHMDEFERSIPNRAQDTHAASGKRISLYSPGWAAPEQLRAHPVGPSADVYALALVIVFMLSGKKVFPDKDVMETVQRRMEGDQFVEYALQNLEIPKMIGKILLGALRSSTSERIPTVVEFLGLFREAAKETDAKDMAKTAQFSRRQPEVPVGGPILTLNNLEDTEILAGGRRVRIVPCIEQVDLGGDGDPVQGPARIRLTVLPQGEGNIRLHVRGLNCFVQKSGSRPSSAVDVGSDIELELMTPSREKLEVVRCAFGIRSDEGRLFPLAGATLSIPSNLSPRAVLLDFGPGREIALVHRVSPRRSP
jgi:serine/threonine-protein kinase